MEHIVWSIGHPILLNDIIRAQNCSLYNSKGNKYIDLESGVWCTSIGHCNPRINGVISSQIEKICHTGFNYCNPVIEETAKTVLEITNLSNGKCEFLNSGSEAVEYCVRVAKTIHEDAKFLTFSDSYFGAYGDATKKESKDWIRYNWMDCSCNSHGEGCIGECDEFNSIPFDQIKTFLFEPGSSSGLVRFPSKKLIETIGRKIKENNGSFVVNEVTTGVGRTGKWFGYQHYNIQPDMVAIGKGIGNGYPVSVAALSEITAKLLKSKPFVYSQSHQNDPLGAAIVKEVIATITDEKLLDRCNFLGNKIVNYINQLIKTNSHIKLIRGRGLMYIIEFTKDAELIRNELLKSGFIVAKRPGYEIIRIDPALTIDEQDVDAFLDSLKSIVDSL